MAFTEQGVAMLSSVLSSEKAIQINIEIMGALPKYRIILIGNDDLKKGVKLLDNKLNEAFKFLLGKMDALHHKHQTEKPEPICCKIKDK